MSKPFIPRSTGNIEFDRMVMDMMKSLREEMDTSSSSGNLRTIVIPIFTESTAFSPIPIAEGEWDSTYRPYIDMTGVQYTRLVGHVTSNTGDEGTYIVMKSYLDGALVDITEQLMGMDSPGVKLTGWFPLPKTYRDSYVTLYGRSRHDGDTSTDSVTLRYLHLQLR